MKLSAAAFVFGLSLGFAEMAAAAPFNDRGQKWPNPSAQGASTQQIDTMNQRGFNDRGKLKPSTAPNHGEASQLPTSSTDRMPIAPVRGFNG